MPKKLLVFSTTITIAFSLYLINSGGVLAQETYNYNIDSGIPQIPVSESFSKTGGGLPTLTVGTQVTQSATIGQVALNRLYGWGAPNIKITVSGIGVSATTTSQPNGYWEFINLYLPRPTYSALGGGLYFPEICVQGFENEVATQPSCIPAYLAEDLPEEVGPVLLSPTLTVENSYAELGAQVLASGRTTPNSTVYINLANENRVNFFSIVRQVSAYYVPSYEIKADDRGYYEFNLPSESPDSWKIYATAEILGAPSPKSTTLDFFALSDFWAFVRKVLQAMQIGRFSFAYVVGLEIALVLILTYVFLRKPKRHKI